MNALFRARLLAWACALASTIGLLVFGWSPTSVLLLYWVETVAIVLVPLVTVLGLMLVRREGLVAGIVLFVVMLLLCAFLAAHAMIISVVGLVEMGVITDLHGTQLTVPLYTPLVVTFRDPFFIASALAVVGLVVFEFHRQVQSGGSPASAPGQQWTVMFNRLFFAQFAMIIGGGAVIVSQLPSTAALVVVALKLWLDLRSARSRATAASASR